MNKIFSGDCLFVMKHDIPEESVDLIYLDPPFFTGNIQKGEVDWEPGAMEISYDDSKQFWGKKEHINAPEWIKHIAANQNRPEFASYLNYMYKRLQECKKILKKTGSIYLHCDYRASHYLKMTMDEVFGVENFRNEIIWCFVGGGYPRKTWGRKHNTILFYTKSNAWTFNTDEVRFEYSGTIRFHANGSKYKNEKKLPEDWWADIFPTGNLGPSYKERLGYPTQKPLTLLERIIKASSNENDLVLDPFCGCGTTIIAAEKLKRKWIGIDISPDACTVMKKRFQDEFKNSPEVIRRQLGEVLQLKEYQLEQWVNDFYDAIKPIPDKGVDGITKNGTPIQTKTGVVNRDIVSKFLTDIKYHEKVLKPIKIGIIFSGGGFDESAIQRAFEIKTKEGIEIKLITPQDILGSGNA
jgi:site-specific DNA-methyltransferase (adenine-specific)